MILHHLGQAAAAILLLELLVVVLVGLAVAGGLAFGLHWLRGKTDWAFGLLNTYLAMVVKYVHAGTDWIGKPFILTGGVAANLASTAEAIQRRVQQIQAARSGNVSIPPTPPIVEPELVTSRSVREP